MSIPFVRHFEFEYEKLDQLTPLIGRLVANNPGPFTYTGTGVYIVGQDNIAVLDPGPNTPDHMAAVETAIAGRNVTHVFVTHHHIDHSPLAAPLAEKMGCKVYGYGKQVRPPEEGEVRLEAGDDLSFKPDVEIRNGDIFEGDGWTLEAIHTPGHTSNHMCFALKEENCLFSGDHIMGWSTSVVSPPDGHMGDYITSLNRVLEADFDKIWPTHGPVINNPREFVSAYIAHRHNRETQICAALADGISSISDIVSKLYADIDKRLHPAAAHSVLSHLIHMRETGRVCSGTTDGLRGEYKLTDPS